MNIVDLLSELETQSIQLWADGARLRCRAPQSALTPEVMQTIKEHREDLLAWLQVHVDNRTSAADHQRADGPTSDSKVSNPWIQCVRPNPKAQLRLFCFPHAGGSASLFHTWANALPDTYEVCAMQLPGRENRIQEMPIDRLSILVEALASVLSPYLDKPFAFFGHSMGTLISFELIRLIRQQYRLSPIHLFVSGYRAPQLPLRHAPLHSLPTEAFVAEVGHRFNGLPKAVRQNDELMAFVLPALRADLALIETYSYQPEAPLACPISVFGSEQDDSVSQTELAAWQEQTLSDFTVRIFPGDHFYLQQQPKPLWNAITQTLTPGGEATSHHEQLALQITAHIRG